MHVPNGRIQLLWVFCNPLCDQFMCTSPLPFSNWVELKMKPSSLPKRSRDQVSSNVSKPLHIGLKGGGCPVGTVPIRRTTKEDLITEKLASKIMTPADDTSGADVSYPSQSRLYSFTILGLHYCLVVIFGFICLYESPSWMSWTHR